MMLTQRQAATGRATQEPVVNCWHPAPAAYPSAGPVSDLLLHHFIKILSAGKTGIVRGDGPDQAAVRSSWPDCVSFTQFSNAFAVAVVVERCAVALQISKTSGCTR